MKLPFYWIDAFASRPFAGNPAGVVLLDRWLPDATMQQIAFENGLAETAFCLCSGQPDRFGLRWFTPTVEVDLCGHATLATAHVVLRELKLSQRPITFDSRSGPLTVAPCADGKLELDFPATPPAPENDPTLFSAVTAALGHRPSWLGRTRFDLFAVLANADAVRTVKPDFPRIAELGGRGLIATAHGDAPCDFVSRFFAPQAGVPEDPATGSAHCALTPYWTTALKRSPLRARQLSARGAEFWCQLAGDRVRIAGNCILYLRGEIEV